MIDDILRAYNIAAERCEVQLLVSGLINRTWRIRYGTDEYILQRINNQVFKKPEAIGDNLRMLADYLALHSPGYLFVAPVATATGHNLVHHPDHGYFRLFPYVMGSHTISVVSSADQAYEAALQFGTFTQKLEGFDATQLNVSIPDFHNLELRYAQFNQAVTHGNAARIRQAVALVDDVRKHEHIVKAYAALRHNPNVRLRVMHHDTKISNVLFDAANRGLCIIDLDTVMPGYFISDVGDMLRTYLSPASEEERDLDKIEVREDIFRAIVQGYAAAMGHTLTRDEQQLILYAGSFLVYMQAIRFLADYFNNDVYYGAKYEEHNLMRAANQLRLLQRLDEREHDFRRIIATEWPRD